MLRWVFRTLAVSMLMLVVTAAIVDRFKCHDTVDNNGKPSHSLVHLLIWFSPVRNTRKLVCTKSYEDLSCVHGLRFVTMIWIIIAHTLEWNNLNTFREYR